MKKLAKYLTIGALGLATLAGCSKRDGDVANPITGTGTDTTITETYRMPNVDTVTADSLGLTGKVHMSTVSPTLVDSAFGVDINDMAYNLSEMKRDTLDSTKATLDFELGNMYNGTHTGNIFSYDGLDSDTFNFDLNVPGRDSILEPVVTQNGASLNVTGNAPIKNLEAKFGSLPAIVANDTVAPYSVNIPADGIANGTAYSIKADLGNLARDVSFTIPGVFDNSVETPFALTAVQTAANDTLPLGGKALVNFSTNGKAGQFGYNVGDVADTISALEGVSQYTKTIAMPGAEGDVPVYAFTINADGTSDTTHLDNALKGFFAKDTTTVVTPFDITGLTTSSVDTIPVGGKVPFTFTTNGQAGNVNLYVGSNSKHVPAQEGVNTYTQDLTVADTGLVPVYAVSGADTTWLNNTLKGLYGKAEVVDTTNKTETFNGATASGSLYNLETQNVVFDNPDTNVTHYRFDGEFREALNNSFNHVNDGNTHYITTVDGKDTVLTLGSKDRVDSFAPQDTFNIADLAVTPSYTINNAEGLLMDVTIDGNNYENIASNVANPLPKTAGTYNISVDGSDSTKQIVVLDDLVKHAVDVGNSAVVDSIATDYISTAAKVYGNVSTNETSLPNLYVPSGLFVRISDAPGDSIDMKKDMTFLALPGTSQEQTNIYQGMADHSNENAIFLKPTESIVDRSTLESAYSNALESQVN